MHLKQACGGQLRQPSNCSSCLMLVCSPVLVIQAEAVGIGESASLLLSMLWGGRVSWSRGGWPMCRCAARAGPLRWTPSARCSRARPHWRACWRCACLINQSCSHACSLFPSPHAMLSPGKAAWLPPLSSTQKMLRPGMVALLLPPPVNRLARVDAVPVCKRCCAEGICPRSG